MAWLDIELKSVLTKMALHKQHPAVSAYFIDPNQKIPVSVHFSGNVDQLKDAGLESLQITGNIASGTVTPEALEKLANIPEVTSIDKIRVDHIQLDDSIPDIHADNIWTRNGDNFSGYTGRGVIVGIIDTGIDFRHRNFRKPDGSSRILKLWDQTINAPLNPPQAGEIPPPAIIAPAPASLLSPLGYGVEYTQTQITNTITLENPPQPVRHKDEDGHGTHVAGIAAGNGKQAGGCHGEYRYIGVAPDADLIVVRRWGMTKGDEGENQTPPANPPLAAPSNDVAIDAVKYIFNEANKLSKPVVINCSFGLFGERMDGNGHISSMVDSILTANSAGKSIVFAAGNDGNKKFHAAATVPASGTLDLEFKIFPKDNKERNLAILYTGSNLEIQVVSPVGGAPGTVPWVALNQNPASPTANGANASVLVHNDPTRLAITITPPNNGLNAQADFNVPNTESSKWKIQLRNTTAVATPINALCLFGSSHDPNSPHFLDHIVTNSTLTEQGSGRECVSVGAYEVGGQLTDFSGRGPTLDGRTKPDLCAPGIFITSTGIAKDRAGDCANCCCECCQDWYVDMQGTSMAAPHVTGTIALMLHKNPGFTHTLIKTNLTSNADGRPGDAPPADVPGWGTGKLSAMNSVNSAPFVNPPVAMVASQEEIRQPILQQFLSTQFGSTYYELGQKYFREILNLINTNKRVATAWHRSKGPVWTRLALTAFNNPEFKVPLAVSGLPINESVERFVKMLKKFASPELRTDIERCEPHVSLLHEGMTMTEMMQMLGNQPLTRKEVSYYDLR